MATKFGRETEKGAGSGLARNRKSSKTVFNKRFNNMFNIYNNAWRSSHREIRQYIVPTRGRFDLQPNDGKMIDHKILLDGHATQANRILSSGLNTGITSKSRPWFKLTVDNTELLDVPGVREWLDEVQKRMYAVLDKSNMYQVFQSTYEELGSFGQGCYIILSDFEDVVRGRSFTAGTYLLGTDEKGRKNAFAREFWMSVEQIVNEFGYDNCSSQVQSNWNSDQLDIWIRVRHLIEENDDRLPEFEDFSNMAFRSVYWEQSQGSEDFLEKRGFKRFRVITPSWETTTTEQIYGYGPGWYALGNVKQLQKTVKDKLITQEKLHNPPMQADAGVTHTNLLPGGVSKTSAQTPNSGLKPAYQINPNLESFIEMENHLKQSIDKDFFVNLFLMLLNIDKTNMTATEIAERQQEKLMMLGPILHRLDEEMLSPTLEIIFDLMSDVVLIPPAPDEIAGTEIKVQYISILAQAQRALGVTQIERVIGFAANLAQVVPQMLDNIDFDEAIREVAEMEGIPASIVRDKTEVLAQREQALRMQQAQQAAEFAASGASTVKDLSAAKMDDESALTNISDAAQKVLQP